jgi:hypothetical protein
MKRVLFGVLLFVSASLAAQLKHHPIDTFLGQPVVRYHLALKYDVSSLLYFIGTGASVRYAPLNCLHVQTSVRAYDILLSGLTGETPRRNALDVYADLLFHVPNKRTFNGFSAGFYYNYGVGSYTYKKPGNPDKEYYEFRRQMIGVFLSAQISPLKRPRLIFEFYAGASKAVKAEIVKGPTMFASNEQRVESQILTAFRGGISLGYAF